MRREVAGCEISIRRPDGHIILVVFPIVWGGSMEASLERKYNFDVVRWFTIMAVVYLVVGAA
ncbi:MAG: hypothetical protein EOM21_16025, partial [Gammaproteobacteria bacterium]|nr:hypothetical protein [Gammaproteobacteria bacterium]